MGPASPDVRAMLTVDDVHFGFSRRPDFLGPVSLEVQGGDCWAIVGPNGAGKSTLLRLMAGLLAPHRGEVRFRGKSLQCVASRDRARSISFVPQQTGGEGDFRVRDVVLMGRFPHRSMGLFESADDHRIADDVMAQTETLELADRHLATLSSGEAQRVHVAAALAQQPSLLLLDEPTASLDIQHQLAVFGILKEQATVGGLAVVVVTHDLNLAARFCTRVLLLSDGKVAAIGAAGEVFTPQTLQRVYGVPLVRRTVPGQPGVGWLVPVEIGRERLE